MFASIVLALRVSRFNSVQFYGTRVPGSLKEPISRTCNGRVCVVLGCPIFANRGVSNIVPHELVIGVGNGLLQRLDGSAAWSLRFQFSGCAGSRQSSLALISPKSILFFSTLFNTDIRAVFICYEKAFPLAFLNPVSI